MTKRPQKRRVAKNAASKAFDRVGLELELLAPEGVTRTDVAKRLASRLKGRVEYGFKYYTEGDRLEDGKMLCKLSDAVRVVDARGEVVLTVVTDNTLHGGLPTEPHDWLMATDDLRIALWIERHCWSRTPHVEHRLAPAKKVFEGVFVEGGLRERFGHPLVIPLREPASFRRACEIVTRPLKRSERQPIVDRVLECARDLGLTLPLTAALHAHYDAAPWRNVARLKRFLLAADEHFAAWREQLKPNPNCLRLGRQPDRVLEVARSAPSSLDFFAFGAALTMAGANKSCDFNLTGVIRRFSKQPTLEVRCLPMSLDAAAVLSSLAKAESLLTPFV